MDKRDMIVVGVVVTFVNIAIFQHTRIAKLQDYLTIAEMRADVNAETTQELIWERVNDVHKATQDQLIEQGRIEGLVAYLKEGEKTDLVNRLWHEGYSHGLNQVQDMERYEHEKAIANIAKPQSDGPDHNQILTSTPSE
jgi:hypothetical protein